MPPGSAMHRDARNSRKIVVRSTAHLHAVQAGSVIFAQATFPNCSNPLPLHARRSKPARVPMQRCCQSLRSKAEKQKRSAGQAQTHRKETSAGIAGPIDLLRDYANQTPIRLAACHTTTTIAAASCCRGRLQFASDMRESARARSHGLLSRVQCRVVGVGTSSWPPVCSPGEVLEPTADTCLNIVRTRRNYGVVSCSAALLNAIILCDLRKGRPIL